MTPYLDMALNNAWANAKLHGAVQGMDKAAFTAQRTGFFPSLSRTLNHILDADLYYLDALEEGGKGRLVFERGDITDPAVLAAEQANADMRLATFCKALAPEVLTETRQTTRAEGPHTETVGPLLLHLFQHQIHHRGQAHTMVLEAGIDPPQLDDFYLEYGRVPSAQAYFGAR